MPCEIKPVVTPTDAIKCHRRCAARCAATAGGGATQDLAVGVGANTVHFVTGLFTTRGAQMRTIVRALILLAGCPWLTSAQSGVGSNIQPAGIAAVPSHSTAEKMIARLQPLGLVPNVVWAVVAQLPPSAPASSCAVYGCVGYVSANLC
eukprot:6016212-Prymnesium_polylepis.1